MQQNDQTERALDGASALRAVEGPHRERLKHELLRRASSKQEDRKMRPGKIAVYATCMLLMLGAAGATSKYVFLHWNTGRPDITMQEPIDVAGAVLAALQKNDFSIVEGLFPPKSELASVFSVDSPFVARYDELKAKLRDEFEQCLIDYPGLANAKLVRVDGDYGELSASPDVLEQAEFFDNAHIFVQIGDLVHDIRLDELIKIRGAWYLVELPGKAGAVPPMSIDMIPEQ